MRFRNLVLAILCLALILFMPAKNSTAQIQIQWEDVTPLQAPKFLLDAAILDGKIYAVGGHRGCGGYLNEVEVYDPVNDSWVWAQHMNISRTWLAVVAFNGEIWAINGSAGGCPHDSIEIYNPTSNTWHWGTPMGIGTEGPDNAVILDGKVYVVSGQAGRCGGFQDFLKMWDGSNWVDMRALPIPIASHSATVANGEIFVTGGSKEDHSISNETYMYDPELDEWREGPELNVPRAYHTSVTVQDKIFVIGGWNWTTNALDSVEVLDLAESNPTWQVLESSELSSPRYFLAAVVFSDEIYIIGGTEDESSELNIVQKGTIILPNQPPTANAGSNIAISSEDQDITILQGNASDPDDDPMIYRWLEEETELSTWEDVGENGEAYLDLSTVLYFSIGDHTLTLEVSDSQVTSTDDMILTVENSAPHPAPIGGGVYEIGSPIILGGQVSDFDGDSVTYEWLEEESVLYTGQVQTIYGGEPVELPNHEKSDFNLGTHTVTLRANDGVNQPVSNCIMVEVIDTGAPTLSPVPDKTILWPPNHKMVDITIVTNASDNSGGPLTLAATVYSNEPEDGLGDGDVSPDWTEPVIDEGSGIINLQLRSERSGSGSGRIYTITIAATDESGNTSEAQVEIIIPHDRRK